MGCITLIRNGSWNFTAVSTIPTRGVFQVDGWGWVDHANHLRGADQSRAEFGSSHAEWRAFGLFYYDGRNVLKTDNRPASVRAADHGAIALGHLRRTLHHDDANTSGGTIDLLGWGALQSGQWGALTQRSGAGAIEVGFQPKGWERVRPWFRTGFYESSGDGNPADSTHGTFFSVLPTPRLYARFPFFNSMNNRDVFGEVILRPTKTFHGTQRRSWTVAVELRGPVVHRRRRVPALDVRLQRTAFQWRVEARQPVRHQRRLQLEERNFHRAVLRLGARGRGDQSNLSRERQRRAGIYGIQLPFLELSSAGLRAAAGDWKVHRSYFGGGIAEAEQLRTISDGNTSDIREAAAAERGRQEKF